MLGGREDRYTPHVFHCGNHVPVRSHKQVRMHAYEMLAHIIPHMIRFAQHFAMRKNFHFMLLIFALCGYQREVGTSQKRFTSSGLQFC